MKKTFSPALTKVIVLHLLSLSLVLLLWLTSPVPDLYETAFARNLESFISFHFFALLPLLQYLLLFLPKSFRKAVWIFPILIMGFFIYCWILVSTAPSETASSMTSWYKPGKQEELLFILIFLAPVLLSSCSASWGAAPFFAGKIIFTAAVIILAAANIHLIILSKHIPYLIILALLAAMARILYLPPKDKQPQSPAKSQQNS